MDLVHPLVHWSEPMSEPAYKAPAIPRAAAILDYVSRCARPPTLSEIARALGYGKSTVHGLLHSLEGVGWVERAGSGFQIGSGLAALTSRASRVRQAAAVARPFMEALAEKLGETVLIGSEQGQKMVVLDCVEGSGEMRLSSRPGMELPKFAAATGKVLLAEMAPDEAAAVLEAADLPRFTKRSITDRGRFLAEVENARTHGYATDDEEYLSGVRAVAAPIRCNGRYGLALWVAGFASRLAGDRLARAGEEVRRTAEAISKQIQAHSPPV
jgi:DNA-binding IclR family transcriptional regulator